MTKSLQFDKSHSDSGSNGAEMDHQSQAFG